MKTKICSRKDCPFQGAEQPIESFSKNKYIKDGLRTNCKTCDKISRKKYYDKNIEIIIQKQKNRYQQDKENIKARARERHQKNKERENAKSKTWKQQHKEEVSVYNKNYKATHKDQRNAHETKRRKEEPIVKIQTSIRNRLRDAVKGEYKTGSAIDLLGILNGDINDFKVWLEEQFYDHPLTGEKMTWENYGRPNGKMGWDIDHIIPLSSVNLRDEKQRRKVCNFFNLRPRWAYQNISEGDRGMSINKK